jgi:hypothetical protein
MVLLDVAIQWCLPIPGCILNRSSELSSGELPTKSGDSSADPRLNCFGLPLFPASIAPSIPDYLKVYSAA